MTTISCTSC